jgi:hypothetical protein
MDLSSEYIDQVWLFLKMKLNSVGDSPRGPHKQQGNPQLKTRNKAKHA